MQLKNNDYKNFLENVKSYIQSSRINLVRTINKELIQLYWKIGKEITNKQLKYGWGKSIVEELAKDIKKEIGLVKGFSSRNLWEMRLFYMEYKDDEFLQQLVAEIPWGHNLQIIHKVKTKEERIYYLQASKDYGWSRNILLNQIKSDAYKRHKLNKKQHNFNDTLPKHLAEQADEVLKDSYLLDFLGIAKPVMERELENRMIEKIRNVIIEFGNGFAFIGNQYRIQTDKHDYYIDLLFYHRKLKSLVAIELKVGEFKPEYAGKMNFYLNLLDDYVREQGENPSIGIILCAQKDRLEVEYSIKSIDKPVGVAEYYLSKELPPELKDKLPDPEKFKKLLLNKTQK